uniref:Inositol-pentakisphosphate 2-kinase n=1 Tax=Caenorhabditis japonica TaxID=281687 RepID=A0A8R1I1A1_CAEJA
MQINPTNNVLVEPRDYRSFCFRGEGRANFVISARHRASGVRIVWRFAKARKSGLMTVKARSELVNSYMQRIIEPLIDREYLVNMSIVEFNIIDVHHLAKIPHLDSNLKIENFEDLENEENFPEDFSYLPKNLFQKGHGSSILTYPKRLTSLQMLDATQLPMSIGEHNSATITVEIKPKQGFLQCHPNVNVPHCNNCILQIEKSCGQSHFSQMYDFCPLDLFSGNFSRMRRAIHSLFLVPHRNLRIFVDGNLVHSDEKPLEQHKFQKTLFPNAEATEKDLEAALCFALSGNESKKNFHLQKDSVLGEILQAQRIDELGIVKAHALYEQLDAHLKASLLDKNALVDIDMSTISSRSNPAEPQFLSQQEQLTELRKYFVAATMKDCSVGFLGNFH